MKNRNVTITLTPKQAQALWVFALEGRNASENLVFDGLRAPDVHEAGVQAMDILTRGAR